jgi:hypothetical protein
MSLLQFLFCVQIIEMENRLSRVEGELKAMKEEVVTTKMEEARKKEEAAKKGEGTKRPKETTKDMVARVAPMILLEDVDAPPSLIIYL